MWGILKQKNNSSEPAKLVEEIDFRIISLNNHQTDFYKLHFLSVCVFFFLKACVHVRRVMRLSCHGGSESTESPSISPHANSKNLGLDYQGASVRFSVTCNFCHVLHSYNSCKFIEVKSLTLLLLLS